MAAQRTEKTRTPGIYRIHARGCTSSTCRCSRYQAAVYSARDRKLIRRHFDSAREAQLWQSEIRGAVERREVNAIRRRTVQEAADELLAGIRDGTMVNRSGRPYKPATIRRYERALRIYLLPDLGHRKLQDVDRRTVKVLVARWQRDGLNGSTIRNNLDPLRVIVREAIDVGELTVDPLAKLRLPQGDTAERHVLQPGDFAAYLEALPEGDRALWGTALFAGLRRGELQALRWQDIDLDASRLTVARNYDDEGKVFVTPKSEASAAPVGIVKPLRALLAAHKLRTGRGDDDLVFGRTPDAPFTPSTIGRRAREAWKAKALEPIVLHGGRHSAASFAHASGMDDVALQGFVRHSDVRTTKNIYVHRFDSDREADVARMDDYLDRCQEVG